MQGLLCLGISSLCCCAGTAAAPRLLIPSVLYSCLCVLCSYLCRAAAPLTAPTTTAHSHPQGHLPRRRLRSQCDERCRWECHAVRLRCELPMPPQPLAGITGGAGLWLQPHLSRYPGQLPAPSHAFLPTSPGSLNCAGASFPYKKGGPVRYEAQEVRSTPHQSRLAAPFFTHRPCSYFDCAAALVTSPWNLRPPCSHCLLHRCGRLVSCWLTWRSAWTSPSKVSGCWGLLWDECCGRREARRAGLTLADMAQCLDMSVLTTPSRPHPSQPRTQPHAHRHPKPALRHGARARPAARAAVCCTAVHLGAADAAPHLWCGGPPPALHPEAGLSGGCGGDYAPRLELR